MIRPTGPNSSFTPDTLLGQFGQAKLDRRSCLLGEVAELLGGVPYLAPTDLLAILAAGYRNMTSADRNEFMRKVLLHLKRSGG